MIYTIDKFRHRHNSCIPLFDRITWSNRIDFIFKFKSDPAYEVPNKSDQLDTNKIFGISDGWHHHEHSIRIGWRHSKILNKTTYCAYYYRDGKHYTEDLGELKINQDIYICIKINKDNYEVITVDNTLTIPRTSKWVGPRYYLYPYFGGQQVAPKQFKIKINNW